MDGQGSGIEEIKTAPITEAFPHEEEDFTPWLEDHIDKLSDESLLGFGLTNVQREKNVEGYRADLVAEDEYEGRTVVIENQFNDSDPDHLGRSLVYAAGTGADVIVWISEKIEEAHANTVRMLNDRTYDEFSIFAVEVKLVQIGDSPPYGVNFEPIVKPSDWNKPEPEVGTQERFWKEFRRLAREEDHVEYARRSERSSPSYHIPLDYLSATYLRPTADSRRDLLHVVVRVRDRSFVGNPEKEETFREVFISDVENQGGNISSSELIFEQTPENKFDKIRLQYDDPGQFKLGETEKWKEYHSWLLDAVHVLDYTLRDLSEQGLIKK